MVGAMGYTSVLGVSVSTVSAAATVSSRDSSSPSFPQDGIHGGHGCRPASSRATTTKRTFEPLLKVVAKSSSSSTPWRRESSFRGRMKNKDVRVQASSSDETSGDKGQVKTENVPGWAEPNSEEIPPWAKNERPASQEPAQDVPFPVYLIGSTLVAIAAVHSLLHFGLNSLPEAADFCSFALVISCGYIRGLRTIMFNKSINLSECMCRVFRTDNV